MTITAELSPKAKENLRKNAELGQKNSKYIKLQPSEKTDINIQYQNLIAGVIRRSI